MNATPTADTTPVHRFRSRFRDFTFGEHRFRDFVFITADAALAGRMQSHPDCRPGGDFWVEHVLEPTADPITLGEPTPPPPEAPEGATDDATGDAAPDATPAKATGKKKTAKPRAAKATPRKSKGGR